MDILIYTKPNCHLCDELKTKLDNNNIVYASRDITQVDKEESASVRLEAKNSGQRMMPIVYIDGVIVRPEDVMNKINE